MPELPTGGFERIRKTDKGAFVPPPLFDIRTQAAPLRVDVRISDPVEDSKDVAIRILRRSLELALRDVRLLGLRFDIRLVEARTGSLELQLELDFESEVDRRLEKRREKRDDILRSALRKIAGVAASVGLSVSLSCSPFSWEPPPTEACPPHERPLAKDVQRALDQAPLGALVAYTAKCGSETITVTITKTPNPRGEIRFEERHVTPPHK